MKKQTQTDVDIYPYDKFVSTEVNGCETYYYLNTKYRGSNEVEGESGNGVYKNRITKDEYEFLLKALANPVGKRHRPNKNTCNTQSQVKAYLEACQNNVDEKFNFDL